MPDSRPNRGWYKPGQTGNPGGRPKVPEWFKEKVPACQKLLWKWAKSKNPRASLQATQLILAYGLGKPTEYHDVSGHLTLEQILAASWTPDGDLIPAGNGNGNGNGHDNAG